MMNDTPSLTYAEVPLGDFLLDLRGRGYHIDANTFSDVSRLLAHVAENANLKQVNQRSQLLHDLKLALRPLVAKTPEESLKFGSLFDQYFLEKDTSLSDQKDPPRNNRKKQDGDSLWRIYIVGVGSFLLLSGIAFFSDLFVNGFIGSSKIQVSQYFQVVLGFSFVILAFLVVFVFFQVFLKRIRIQGLFSRRGFNFSPPYAYLPDIRLPRLSLFNPQEALAITEPLRQRRVPEFNTAQIDVGATIDRTIQRAGQIQPVFRKGWSAPEYLFLLDEAALGSHLQPWFEGMLALMRAHGVRVQSATYRDDPRQCREANGVVRRLSELAAGQRLLLLTTGEALIDPVLHRPYPWSARLLGSWQAVGILTPRLPSDWGLPEKVLQKQLPLAPATVAGLLAMLDDFDRIRPIQSAQWRPNLDNIWLDRPTVSRLQSEVDPTTFQWIAACAFYPKLYWDLTLQLGTCLETRPGELLNQTSIEQLLRIAWFRQGKIPAEQRRKLMQSLSPEIEQQVRRCLQRVFSEATATSLPPRSSLAWQQFRLEQLLNELALNDLGDPIPKAPAKTRELRRLWRKQGLDQDPFLDDLISQSLHWRKVIARYWRAIQHRLRSNASSSPQISFASPKERAPYPVSKPTPPLPPMISIPGGSFLMGSPEGEGHSDERPQHRVTVPDFFLAETPVTVAQYLAFCEATDSHWPEWLEEGSKYNVKTGSEDHYKQIGDALSGPDHPIVGVSWHNAIAYCEWLSQEIGQTYRLPSEAEWEYAAGGGTQERDAQGNRTYIYAGSNDLDAVGWYTENTKDTGTRPVKQKLPNALGLSDMSGNVWEWCQDAWHGDYKGAPTDGSAWESGVGASRVMRGGSWLSDADRCRVAGRGRGLPDNRNFYLGFRLART